MIQRGCSEQGRPGGIPVVERKFKTYAKTWPPHILYESLTSREQERSGRKLKLQSGHFFQFLRARCQLSGTNELCYSDTLFASKTTERRSPTALKTILGSVNSKASESLKGWGSTLKLWHTERLPVSRETPGWLLPGGKTLGDTSHLGRASVFTGFPHWLKTVMSEFLPGGIHWYKLQV